MQQAASVPRTSLAESSDASSADERLESPRETAKIVLVDDHPAIREALASAINKTQTLHVTGAESSAEDAVRAIEQTSPDVIVADLSLNGTDGLALIHLLRARAPDARILIFSVYDEAVFATRALRAGASGYVMKTASLETLIDAVQEVAAGRVYLSSSMRSRVLSTVIGASDPPSTTELDQLSDRELTVFRMLGEGRGMDEITEQLSLNRKTVEAHRRSAKEKLGHESVDDLLQSAIRWTSRQG